MNEPKQYQGAGAFRRALEARLLGQSLKEGVDKQRLRRKVAFDRLLARLFANVEKESPWVLKGGYAMELRIQSARTTKDIDLTLRSGRVAASDADQQSKQLRELVQEFSSASLPDYFQFLVGQAMLELGGAPGGGYRYPIEARMDGRMFTKFHLDIGIGDEILTPLEVINGWIGLDSQVSRHPRSRCFRASSNGQKSSTPTRARAREDRIHASKIWWICCFFTRKVR